MRRSTGERRIDPAVPAGKGYLQRLIRQLLFPVNLSPFYLFFRKRRVPDVNRQDKDMAEIKEKP
jgi:hypothetical protein